MTGFCPHKKGPLKESECHYDGYCSECPHNTKDDTISRQAVLALARDLTFEGIDELKYYKYRCIDPNDVQELPSAQPTFEPLSMEEFVEEISPTTPDTIVKWLDLAWHIYGMGYRICRK